MTIDRLGPKIRRFVKDESAFTSKAKHLATHLSDYWLRPRPSGPVDVVDFFSGCGGMSAGFQALNALVPAYRIALAVDIDKDANSTYAENIGVVPEPIDIGTLSKSPAKIRKLIRERRGSSGAPWVMIGCAPCQGFSSHRNASGETDLRNSLFVAFAKIAATALPDVVIVENVPEILTDRYWPLVERARAILSAAGYYSLLTIHDMAEYGVPQQRYRALMVAMRHPFEMPKGFLKRGGFVSVRDAIGDLQEIAPGKASTDDAMHFSAGHKQSTVNTIKQVPRDGGSRPWNAGPDCLRRASARQGRAAYEDVYGRLWWDRPAITITAYARNPASGRFVHPDQDRGLSIREAGLLQGFPNTYTFCGGFDSRFRQIGNAVPPAFSSYLAAHILRQMVLGRATRMPQADIIAPIGPSFSRMIPALKAGHRKLTDHGMKIAAEAA